MSLEKQEAKAEVVAAKKLHWRVAAALRQMTARREQLLEKRALLNKEIEELDAAILALE